MIEVDEKPLYISHKITNRRQKRALKKPILLCEFVVWVCYVLLYKDLHDEINEKL